MKSEETNAGEDERENNLQVTSVFGDIGRHQWIISFLCMLSCIIGAWCALGYTFLSFPMEYWCARPQEPIYMNLSVSEWKKLAIPLETQKGKEVRSKCSMYDVKQESGSIWVGNTTSHCRNWEFDRSFYDESIVSEWYLTCDRSWMVSMSQSVYMGGFLIAVLVFGQLGDKYGRRPVMMICVSLCLSAGFALYFSSSFILFVVFRFLVAMGIHGLYTTGFVALMESAGPKYRPRLSMFMGLGWATGFITLPGLAYLTRSWHNLQLTIALCSLTLFSFAWLMPESARWLLTQGKMEEAEEALTKAAKRNGRWNQLISPIITKKLIQKAEEEIQRTGSKRPTLVDLLRTPNMRKKTLLMFYAWFVTSFVYYGLSLNTGDLGGDPFVNFAIAGAVEYPCVVAGYYIMNYLGRRKPLAFCLVFAAASCLATIPVPDDLLWLRITLAMLGKCGVSIAFGLVYIFSAELNPTVVRNVGVGSSSTCARVGSVLAPFVKELGKATNRSIPMVVFGTLTALSGFLVLLLPETMNTAIPDTLEEGEEFGKKKKTKREDDPQRIENKS